MSNATTQTFIRPAFGWRQKQEDYCHLHLTKTTFRTSPHLRAPGRLDPRSWLNIRSSSSMLSSCGDALATCLEMIHWLKTGGEIVRLSRIFAYVISQKMDGLNGRDVGATVAGSVKASKVFGVCRERMMRTRSRYSDGFTVAARVDAAAYRAVSHSLLGSYDEVFQYLAKGLGAVLLATTWRESLARVDGRIDDLNGRILGAHVLAIVGYVDDVADDEGRAYLLAANSHDRDWGENGFSLIAPRLFDAWGADRASLLVGLSDLHRYQQRDFPAVSAG